MNRLLGAVSLLVVLLSACTAAPTPAVVIVMATPTQTATPTRTPSPTNTPVFTPTAAATPTPTCRDQDLGDLSDPGNPPEPTRADTPYPELGFVYDEEDYDIFRREMHGRIITVAIAKDFVVVGGTRQESAEFIFDTWAVFWNEFGGFPFPSYTVVIGHNLPETDESGVGFNTDHQISDYGWYAHGIFHAWNGNAFRQDGERSWFMEGVTGYYDGRQSRIPLDEYMQGPYNDYLTWRDVERDEAVGDMSMRDQGYDHYFVGMKGRLIAYLLDLELKKTGHHLGEVLGLVYQRYGIESEGRPTNEELLAIFSEVSGADFRPFFERYIYGTDSLPLDGHEFVWVCHDNEVMIIPTSTPTPQPEFALVIDGRGDDWVAFAPLLRDPEGDSLVGGSMDLEAIHVAQDANFVALMIRTYGELTEQESEIDLWLDLLPGSHCDESEVGLSIHPDNTVGLWDSTVCGQINPAPIAGALVRWDEVIEIQIPRQALGEHERVTPVAVNFNTPLNGRWTSADVMP